MHGVGIVVRKHSVTGVPLAQSRTDTDPSWKAQAMIARDEYCDAFMLGDADRQGVAMAELLALLNNLPKGTFVTSEEHGRRVRAGYNKFLLSLTHEQKEARRIAHTKRMAAVMERRRLARGTI